MISKPRAPRWARPLGLARSLYDPIAGGRCPQVCIRCVVQVNTEHAPPICGSCALDIWQHHAVRKLVTSRGGVKGVPVSFDCLTNIMRTAGRWLPSTGSGSGAHQPAPALLLRRLPRGHGSARGVLMSDAILPARKSASDAVVPSGGTLVNWPRHAIPARHRSPRRSE